MSNTSKKMMELKNKYHASIEDSEKDLKTIGFYISEFVKNKTDLINCFFEIPIQYYDNVLHKPVTRRVNPFKSGGRLYIPCSHTDQAKDIINRALDVIEARFEAIGLRILRNHKTVIGSKIAKIGVVQLMVKFEVSGTGIDVRGICIANHIPEDHVYVFESLYNEIDEP